MNYTNDKEQIVFLKDADIARTIDGKTVSADTIELNGVPSFDLFKEKYDELSTYDNNLCSYAANLCADVSNLSDELSTVVKLSVENLQGQVTANDNDIEFLSGQHNWLSDELSTVVKLSVENLQGQVISNDDDINFLSAEAKRLSSELSNNIDDLSASLCGVVKLSVENLQDQITGNDDDIGFLSTTVEEVISADLYELSAGTKETSAFLSGQVKALWDDVKGGVNYKGHLKSYRDTEHNVVDLSAIFLHSFTEYAPETMLNNGWLYCFTTDEITKKYTTKDGIELENRDYIVIHSHDASLSAIAVSAISRDTVDLIDTADDDYVRLDLLNAVSTDLSTDYVSKILNLSTSLSDTASLSVKNLQDQIIANDNDIEFLSGQHDWLSDELSADVNKLSDNLSTDISCLSIAFRNDITYISNEVSCNDNDIEFLSGQHDWLSDELSANISVANVNLSNDISFLSTVVKNTISADLYNLSGQVLDNDTDILNIQNYISGDNSLCTELSNVQYHYGKTFVEDTYELGPDKKVDVLKIVNSQNTEVKFKLIYLSGTLVLETI